MTFESCLIISDPVPFSVQLLYLDHSLQGIADGPIANLAPILIGKQTSIAFNLTKCMALGTLVLYQKFLIIFLSHTYLFAKSGPKTA